MSQIESVLAADCGSAVTTAALIERVRGHYRFVAHGEAASSYDDPDRDVSLGVRRAVRKIEYLVGRRLLTHEGDLITPRRQDGDGVDAFVLVASAAEPVRTALFGLTRHLSLASAERALASTYAVVTGCASADDEQLGGRQEALLQLLEQAEPEAIVLCGGIDGGAERAVLRSIDVVDRYCRAQPSGDRPIVVYAGNARLAPEVRRRLTDSAELRVAANVQPTLDSSYPNALRAILDAIYCERKLAALPGMRRLQEWANAPLLPTARSYAQTIHLLARRYQLRVIGCDLGSRSTTLILSNDLQSACALQPELGVGSSAPLALERVPLERVLAWLPFPIEPGLARVALVSAGGYAQRIAADAEGTLLEQAFACELLRQVASTARTGRDWPGVAAAPWDLIVAAGRTVTHAPHPAYVAWLLLNGLEPVGVSKLAIDAGNVAGMLGALANFHPAAAADVIEFDAFLTLGTLVALAGQVRPGEVALRLGIVFPDGRTEQHVIRGGSLVTILLDSAERVRLELHPARGLDVGIGAPGQSVTVEAEGGTLGIVVDARGRPLTLPADPGACRQLIEAWLSDLGIVIHPFEETLAG